MWAQAVSNPAPAVPFGVAIGDLNGDGKPDLAVSGYQNSVVQLLLNSGSGAFTAGQSLAVGGSTRGVRLADLDGNGLLDIITVSERGGGVAVLLGQQPAGMFSAPQTYATGSFPAAMVARDVNGDSIPDLIVANGGDRNISILPGLGDGTFAAAEQIPLSFAPSGLDVADLDGDGRLDLVAVGLATNQAVPFLNQSH